VGKGQVVLAEPRAIQAVLEQARSVVTPQVCGASALQGPVVAAGKVIAAVMPGAAADKKQAD